MAKSFVIGDIHGAYRALRQCLDRSTFDYNTDHLICLGDVCDGWPDTKICVDELLNVKNLTYIMGNHDLLALQWMLTSKADEHWLSQGGDATRMSYSDGVPPSHMKLLTEALPYFQYDDSLYVHAGFDPAKPVEKQDLDVFLWDRSLARIALNSFAKKGTENLTVYREVYVGHTPIPFPRPIMSGGIWLMDTGAGWSGVLSIMDIATKEFFTSDAVPELYPGVKGRARKLT